MNKLLPSVKSLITLAALLCFLFQASAAQAQKVSLSVRNATVKAAIERLQKDYGYSVRHQDEGCRCEQEDHPRCRK